MGSLMTSSSSAGPIQILKFPEPCSLLSGAMIFAIWSMGSGLGWAKGVRVCVPELCRLSPYFYLNHRPAE